MIKEKKLNISKKYLKFLKKEITSYKSEEIAHVIQFPFLDMFNKPIEIKYFSVEELQIISLTDDYFVFSQLKMNVELNRSKELNIDLIEKICKNFNITLKTNSLTENNHSPFQLHKTINLQNENIGKSIQSFLNGILQIYYSHFVF